jgi:1-deoxy-D-xylulose-5-phosphate reductoisomerase
MQKITILGSTGTIGVNTLDVVEKHPEKFSIYALTAHSNTNLLFEQCQKYSPAYAVMVDAQAAQELQQLLNQKNSRTEVLAGKQALIEIAGNANSEIVVAGIVGAAGLLPTLAAVKSNRRVLLANKEPLVMAGSLFMEAVKDSQAELIPLDSEHNALMQCFPSQFQAGAALPTVVDSVVITASGGPFRLTPLQELHKMTPEQAIAHPNWKMGAKISVDSATMMNKGLEVIEAHWLFNLPEAKIEVVLHPQSVVHSFVRYQDGSTLAQLSSPDMRIPIATALCWPERLKIPQKPFNVLDYGTLHFEPVCLKRYPCLDLAYKALKAGGSATCVLNAANEVAVQAFLQNQIGFCQIYEVVDAVLNAMVVISLRDIETVLEVDSHARKQATNHMRQSFGVCYL